MINIKFFGDILKKYSLYNQRRHEVIKSASDALRTSKQVIFETHRGGIKEAANLLKQAEKYFETLEEMFKKDPELRTEGSYLAAIEEYVEAKFYYQSALGEGIDYLDSKFPIGYDEYLSGICDLTGELTRRAISLATEGKLKEVLEVKETVQDIVGELIKFDLVGKLRNKYDEAKRNLKRLEEIVYDMKIRGYK